MTSSDMRDTRAGRRAARADGPRSSQPKRRTFTAAYKLAMIEKYDAATEPGAKGALLRGEGLYDSHISYWRKARNSGSLASSAAAAVPAAAVPAVAPKGRPAGEAENERLRKRSAKAEVKLEQTRAALENMGKALVGWPGASQPRAPTESVRNGLPLYGSCRPGHLAAGFAQAQCAKYRGRVVAASAMDRVAFFQVRSFLYLFVIHPIR